MGCGVNFFGSQKGNMGHEKDEVSKEQSGQSSGRAGKKSVDLFPAVADRKAVAMLQAAAGRASSVTHVGTQISMFSPSSFDEGLDIVECLRSRAAITICLENLRKSDANRLVDFVAGASAAIDGDFHQMSDQVYLFTPSNIRIVKKEKDLLPSSLGRGSGLTSALDFLYPDRAERGQFGAYGTREQ